VPHEYLLTNSNSQNSEPVYANWTALHTKAAVVRGCGIRHPQGITIDGGVFGVASIIQVTLSYWDALGNNVLAPP